MKPSGALQSPASIGALQSIPVSVGKKTEMCICVYVCVHEVLRGLLNPFFVGALQNTFSIGIHEAPRRFAKLPL